MCGMREITAALLRERLARGHLSLLDAGCGTGGFLRLGSRHGLVRPSGRRGHQRGSGGAGEAAVPGAELHVAPAHDLPFSDGTFDVAVLNDVLQHVDEREVDAGLRELRRVLRPDGVLLVRTNGARHARRERTDWRLYDADSLKAELEAAASESFASRM